MSHLRRVDTTPLGPPLSREELLEKGNALLKDARVAAIDAIRASMHSEFIASNGRSLTRADIRGWRGRARASIEAWRKVESITTELLNEIERTATSPNTGGSDG